MHILIIYSHRINYDWLEEAIIEYLQDICEKFCKDYDFNELFVKFINLIKIVI